MIIHQHVDVLQVLAMILIYLLAPVGATIMYSDSCTFTDIPHCTVIDGAAKCLSPTLPPVVTILPDCITKFHFRPKPSENGPMSIEFEGADFHRLSNLRELVIDSFDREHYSENRIDTSFLDNNFFNGLGKLQILRIRIFCLFITIPSEFFQPLKAIQVLDFTRSQRFSIKQFTNTLQSLKSKAVEKLVLKNIQTVVKIPGRPYSEVLNLTALLCPLGKTLEVVDLSFNDFLVLIINEGEVFCMSELKYLDLSFNLFVQAEGTFSKLDSPWMLFGILYRLEYFNMGQQWYQVSSWETGLWEGDDISSLDSTKTHQKKMPILQFAYMYFKNISTQCALKPLHMLSCVFVGIPFDRPGTCSFLKCVDTSFNLTKCLNDGSVNMQVFIQEVFSQQCNFTECLFGLPVPLPPYAKTIVINYYNDYHTVYEMMLPEVNQTMAVCIYDVNDLETLDLSTEMVNKPWDVDSANKFIHIYLKGLRGLKQFVFHDNRAPSLNSKLFSDMPSLEVVKLAGNNMTKDSSIPLNFFQTNKNLKFIDLSGTMLKEIAASSFSHLKLLHSLDLSNNMLSSLNIDLSETNLSHLNLHNNKLVGLSLATRKQLENLAPIDIDLSSNPLSCDCANLEFIEWLQNEDAEISFLRIDDYTCTYSLAIHTVIDIDINKLKHECSNSWIILLSVFGTLGCILITVLPVVIYKKRWILKHYIFNFTERLAKKSDNDLDVNFDYDAFVLYSSDDEDRVWVHLKLVQELENKYGFKLCIHHRDFIGGWDIADNIEQAITKSRKVIAIISPSFIASKWCITEVQMTNTVDADKLLLVMYKGLPLGADIPFIIRHLLETRVYIEWDQHPDAQRLFWQKICQAIYAK